MAWVSMREGLIQFDNGTQGVKTIGVIVSKSATAPAYASVKDLPGFYTRKTKIDGTPRTVYLSMTDKMKANKFDNRKTISIDGQATGFVSAIIAAPELLHPNTSYYAHLYEITGTTGIAIEKLLFTTENFPTTYPTSQGTYSTFFNQITTASTSPAMEYKASETYLIPVRFYSYEGAVLNIGSNISYHINPQSGSTRPFQDIFSLETTKGVFYDLYNINPSGATEDIILWEGMIGVFNTISDIVSIQKLNGDPAYQYYNNNKAILVTE